MTNIYVVVDWDREEVVGPAVTRQDAEVIKDDYCDGIGIAPDGGGEEPRFRVTIENIEVEDDDG